ncbi:MAG: R3H domain-containing nucleic acid-binding protein [Candidatus Moraniibacteriota bacterium]
MSERNFQESVSGLIRDFFERLGVSPVEVNVFSGRPGVRESFVFSVNVPKTDSKILIGQHGVTLSSIQHLLQTIAKQSAGNGYETFSVDVNDYWKDKARLLRRDAEEAAHQVVASGRPVSLRPMYAYERKIVHSVLAEDERVETESSGHGEERKVIVKPKALFS